MRTINARLSNSGRMLSMAFAMGLSVFSLACVFNHVARADIFFGADYVDGVIYKFDSSTEGGSGTVFAHYQHPYRLAVNDNQNLFVAGPFTNVIEQFDVFGNEANSFNVGTNGIVAIAFDHHGSLFAADSVGDIFKIDSNGVVALFTNSGFASISALAFDSNNNLYFAAGGPNFPAIYKLDESGNSGLFATNGLGQPLGMSFDTNNNLWVGNNALQGISVFDTNGDETFFNTGFYHNSGIAFDHNGQLYVSTLGSPSGFVAVFDPADSGPIYDVYNINDPLAVAFVSPLPLPTLGIMNSNNQIIVFWRYDFMEHSLQTTYDPVSGAWTNTQSLNWTNTPYIGLTISNPPPLSTSFYRLKY